MATNVTLSSSVRSNLLALQRTQSAIDVTNSRLNTGKKVNSVIDDAVAFFSAKALDDRASDFENRKADIDQAISSVNAALTATNAIDSLLKQLKGIVTSAKSATSTERGTLQTQYNTVKSQIDQLVADASYQGLNLVNNSTAKLGVQFSDRSSSRLDITANRLTTLQINSQVGAAVVSIESVQINSRNAIYAANRGLYFVVTVTSTNALNTNEAIIYNQLTSTANISNSVNIAHASNTSAWAASVATSQFATNTFANTSGLNVFAASAIYIYVASQVTGNSATANTTGTGTLWSAASFDVNTTGNANDQFTQALDFMIRSLDSAISQNNSVAKALGTNVAILNTRLEFTKEYVNNQKEGSGKLTLADTNEEGANLVSLQTRQQLGVQALSFAGQTEQSVLRLFG